MRSDIPRAFRDVDLRNASTWQRATLAEWIEKRQELKKHLTSSRRAKEEFLKHLRLVSRAQKRLRAEEEAAGRRIAGPYSGRQAHRLGEIVEAMRPRRSSRRQGITRWESDFLRASEWLEPFLVGELPPDPEIAFTLFYWVLRSEAESRLAAKRAENCQLLAASVAVFSSRRMSNNGNPYLPHPLELIKIYELAILVAGELKRRLARARARGVEPDEYGAAYPCPECGEKFYSGTNALKCHGNLTRERELQFMEVLFVGNDDHRSIVQLLVNALWTSGFRTPVLADEAMDWADWPTLLEMPQHALARELVGRIFMASPDTVRRKIQRAELLREYRRYRVARALRTYCDRSPPRPPFALLRPGWYRDLDRRRFLKPEYLGSMYGRMHFTSDD